MASLGHRTIGPPGPRVILCRSPLRVCHTITLSPTSRYWYILNDVTNVGSASTDALCELHLSWIQPLYSLLQVVVWGALVVLGPLGSSTSSIRKSNNPGHSPMFKSFYLRPLLNAPLDTMVG